jgi:hypothetical protein
VKKSEEYVCVFDERFLTERENGLKTLIQNAPSLWLGRVVNNKLCGNGSLIHFDELK